MYMYLRIYMCVYMCMYMYMYMYIRGVGKSAQTREKYIYICTYTYHYMYIYLSIYIYTQKKESAHTRERAGVRVRMTTRAKENEKEQRTGFPLGGRRAGHGRRRRCCGVGLHRGSVGLRRRALRRCAAAFRIISSAICHVCMYTNTCVCG